MFEEELRCPNCHRQIGVAKSNEHSIAKVSLVAPKVKTAKCGIFESKCPKCKKAIYVIMAFID